jgi:hypothetical protein
MDRRAALWHSVALHLALALGTHRRGGVLRLLQLKLVSLGAHGEGLQLQLILRN